MPTGVYPRTKEIRQALSNAKKGKPSSFKGKHHTLKTRKLLSRLNKRGIIGNKGKKFSEEHKRKIGEALTGEKHPCFGIKEEKATNWKGDNVGYDGLHSWIKKHRGTPTKCESCGANGLSGKQIHWANKDHQYKRNLEDWLRLCALCHRQYDKENGIRGLYG